MELAVGRSKGWAGGGEEAKIRLKCPRQALVSWVLFEGAPAGSVTRWPLRGRK